MAKKKRRRLNFKGQIVAFLFSFLLCSFVLLFVFSIWQNGEVVKEVKKDDTSVKIQDKEEKISLVMVGDNLIHDKIYREAKIDNGYDFSKMYSLVKERIHGFDLAYYNQETILGGSEIGVSSYPSFNSPYEVGDAMIDAGFNLVSLATNHTLDRGEKAVLNSRNYWNNHKDVLAVGSYSSFDEKNEVQIREVGGISYTILNYTYGTNGIRVPNGKEYLVNVWPVTGNRPDSDSTYQEYKEQVKKDIDMVRGKVDLLLVAMHWGVEYQYSPNAYQKDMAKFLADLGVDIIIGTHPHVIQPIEWIDDTLVIYSLGNFISAHEVVDLGNRIGLMSSLDVIKKDGKIEITNLENELLYTYYTNQYKDFLVVPFSYMKEEYLADYHSVYLKYKDIVQQIDSNIKVVEIK